VIDRASITAPDEQSPSEYTTRCGWIDWGHATPNRDDAVYTWAEFPHPIRPGQLPLDLQVIRPSFRRAFQAMGVPHLDGYIVRHVPVITQGAHRYLRGAVTFFYNIPRGRNEEEYRNRYLYMYQRGCRLAEAYQSPHRLMTPEHSVNSFEDLVSNLLAFYANVMGLAPGRYDRPAEHGRREQAAKTAIRRIAGGFEDRGTRVAVSTAVFEGMHSIQASLRATNWTDAYLFNDLVPARHRPNSLRGWQPLPQVIRRIQPAQSYCFPHAAREAIQSLLETGGDAAEWTRERAADVAGAVAGAGRWIRDRVSPSPAGGGGGEGAPTGVGGHGSVPGVEGATPTE
jgi:hypothetical protein